MSLLRTDRSWREEVRHRVPVRYLPRTSPDHLRGTWREANVTRIEASLGAALRRPTHGWLVAAASADVPRDRTVLRTVAGREVVLWRGEDGSALAGPGACPHLGARLDACDVVDGTVLCRWHGMQLDSEGTPAWRTYPAHDDGILFWVRLGEGEGGAERTDRPAPAARPPLETSLASVISLPVTCEPRDIIQNRLDPWHGAWLHPYAFSDLAVDDDASTDDLLVLDVAYRLGRWFAVPVRAEFSCPDSHTIVMTITGGEGTGSVVETHATPLTAPGVHPARTVMTEAVVATSDRFGFRVARGLAPLVSIGMRASATQLWADDLVYAARLYELRRAAADR